MNMTRHQQDLNEANCGTIKTALEMARHELARRCVNCEHQERLSCPVCEPRIPKAGASSLIELSGNPG